MDAPVVYEIAGMILGLLFSIGVVILLCKWVIGTAQRLFRK